MDPNSEHRVAPYTNPTKLDIVESCMLSGLIV